MYEYIAIVALTLIALLLPLLRVGRRPKDLPPGPPTIPVLGNVHLMPTRDLHLQFEKWAKQYGPVYSIMLGTKTMVVLSSDQAVVDLLDKRGAIYSDRGDHYLAGEVLSQGNRMAFMHYGPTWRMLQRTNHKLLNKRTSQTYVPYQDLESKQMLTELLETPKNFQGAVQRYALSVVSSMIFGFRIVKLDDPVKVQLFHVVDDLTEIAQSASGQLLEVFPILRSLPDLFFPERRRAKDCHVKEHKLFTKLWQDAKKGQRSTRPTYCADLARVQQAEGLSDDLAAYTAGSLLEAGADTTSNTLYGFVQAMVLFPEAQRKAQSELDLVVGKDRMPTIEDYPNLPYIRSCVKEATRWMPSAILAIPHAVTEDNEYLGYRIPKGASVVLNAWTISRDPERHHDPERFDPDRFKDSTSSLTEAVTSLTPSERPTFTFGAGRRICTGMHVAENSLFLAIARILWAFDIMPVKDADGVDVLPDPSKLTQGFVCGPESYEADIRPRSTQHAEIVRRTWKEAQRELNPDTQQWHD